MAIAIIGTSSAKDSPQFKNTAPTTDGATAKPTRGMSTRSVKKKFGQPEKILSAIGKPPISRWIYKDFIVYFENSRVIHTVNSNTKASKAN